MFSELTKMCRYRWLLASLFLISSAVAASAATNSVTITEKAGRTTENYPIQIGRPFVQAEIRNFPQALVNGTAVTTQADVKTRWPDRSVKHAILTFLIPTLNANSSVTVTFRNQRSGDNSGYLTQAQMLGTAFDFDATMDLTHSGTTVSASARTMLDHAAFTYWLQGSVATGIVLADHSATRAYDVGFDAHKSIRPSFEATFWPAINKIHVRFITEIANTESLQDQTYVPVYKTGHASPTQVYTRTSFTHCARTRPTRDYWIGGAPSAIVIDHNLSYLASTKHIPNYDTTKVIPEVTLANRASTWAGVNKDLGDLGLWDSSGGAAGGGHPDVGLLTGWDVAWLYSMHSSDVRMQTMTRANTDLAAGRFNMHVREGNASRYFDTAHTIPGIGKVASTRGRPMWFTWNETWFVYGSDAPTPVGTMTALGGIGDFEHLPEPFYVQYLLTGEFFYLEEMYFWNAHIARVQNPVLRGPTGAEGLAFDESARSAAWAWLRRGCVAMVAPDGSAEKAYFGALLDEAIAAWEGWMGITTTAFHLNTMWNWGQSGASWPTGNLFAATRDAAGGVPPLGHWYSGFGASTVAYGIDQTKISASGDGGFQGSYIVASLGVLKRMGFATGALFSHAAQALIGQLTNPGDIDPHRIGSGYVPLRDTSGAYFTTWAQVAAAYAATWPADGGYTFVMGPDNIPEGNYLSYWDGLSISNGENDYGFLVMAALSMATGEPNGQAAWNWILARVANDPHKVLNANPKWCLVPDGGPSAPRGVTIRH